MQDISNIAILGAGAMGAYFASRFASTPGFNTSFVADGERRDRLNQDGLIVNGQSFHVPAVAPSDAAGPADLILVALKHHQLANALSGLDNLVGPETIFLSVMNGLESEQIIGSFFGMEKVLYALSLGIDAVREGSQVTYTAPGTHVFGEAKNLTLSPRVLRVQAAFDKAGIHYQTPPDMIQKLWWKFMVNVGINQASAIMRAPYGYFQSDPDARGFMTALMEEVLILAKAENVNLSRVDLDGWFPVLNQLSPKGKTSMLQDIEAGRKTEVEIFAGKIVSLGKTHGIPTPINQAVFQIIRVLEQTGGGVSLVS